MFSNFCGNFVCLSPEACPTKTRQGVNHTTCRNGISGEVHGNLEADLAVSTPACSSCSFTAGHCLADMKFISVSSSGPRCPYLAHPGLWQDNTPSDMCRRERVVGFLWSSVRRMQLAFHLLAHKPVEVSNGVTSHHIQRWCGWFTDLNFLARFSCM